jgi:hypothetical protein
MRYEEIGDKVDVIAMFTGGKIQPLKFRWKERVYRVERINGEWISDQGQTRFYHFSIMTTGPDVYEITFNIQNRVWILSRVCLVG